MQKKEQEQIEEIARTIGEENGYACIRDTLNCEKCILKSNCIPITYAKIICKAGYRKINKNKIANREEII